MADITAFSKEQLQQLQAELIEKYNNFINLSLNLDMSRGKPGPLQLDYSNAFLNKLENYITENGTDARNYGILTGLPETKRFFGDLLNINPDNIIIGNNSVLNLIYDTMAKYFIFGSLGSTPWGKLPKIKFLCFVPGYDRHFAILEEFGVEMISVPLNADGPDMDIVEKLVEADESIKGMFCTPLHSNPDGTCYSDEVVKRIAKMKTAASDFKIFWDNAYGVHHIYKEVPLLDIFKECEKYNTQDRVLYFFSTSKVMFPGSGLALVAASEKNVAELTKRISMQTIGSDKLNQLRVLQFLKTPDNLRKHMKILGDYLKPKFDVVIETLKNEFEGTNLCKWTTPMGGYFITLYTLNGCAKETIELAKKAGVVLTAAGSTHPYKKDPNDNCVRLAPSYPEIDELTKAIEIVCTCAKLACVNKLLSN